MGFFLQPYSWRLQGRLFSPIFFCDPDFLVETYCYWYWWCEMSKWPTLPIRWVLFSGLSLVDEGDTESLIARVDSCQVFITKGMDTTTLFWAIQSELLLSPHPWYVLVIMSQNRGSTEHWLRFLLKYVYIPCVEGLQNDNDNDTLFLIIMVSRKETQDRKGNRKKTRRGFVAHWMLGEVTWFWEAESQYTALQSMAKKGAANKKLKLHCFGYFRHQLGSLWIYKHLYIYIYIYILGCLDLFDSHSRATSTATSHLTGLLVSEDASYT